MPEGVKRRTSAVLGSPVMAVIVLEIGQRRGESSYASWALVTLGDIAARSTSARTVARDASHEMEAAHALLTELGMTRWLPRPLDAVR
jgi:hypothetical protein